MISFVSEIYDFDECGKDVQNDCWGVRSADVTKNAEASEKARLNTQLNMSK